MPVRTKTARPRGATVIQTAATMTGTAADPRPTVVDVATSLIGSAMGRTIAFSAIARVKMHLYPLAVIGPAPMTKLAVATQLRRAAGCVAIVPLLAATDLSRRTS